MNSPNHTNTDNTHEDANIPNKEYADNTQIPAAPSVRPVGRPRTTVRNGPSKHNGLQPGLERFSVIVDSAQVETLRDIAWQTRRSLKDLVAEAFEMLIDSTSEADKAPRPRK